MSVTVAPDTAPWPKPATLSGTVLLAVKAEVAAAAAATPTPASRTRDMRMGWVLFSGWLRPDRMTLTRPSEGCALTLTLCLRPGTRHSQLLSQKKLESLDRRCSGSCGLPRLSCRSGRAGR